MSGKKKKKKKEKWYLVIISLSVYIVFMKLKVLKDWEENLGRPKGHYSRGLSLQNIAWDEVEEDAVSINYLCWIHIVFIKFWV